jgi:DDE superfamily endonuclease
LAAGQAVDYQSRSGVCPQKKARDRLIRLATSHPEWALGFEDETWWSRLAQPLLHAWTPAQQPLRFIEQTVPSTDPDPKALACYGLLVQERTTQGVSQEQVWLRFVTGRPVSAVTVEFLTWACAQLTTAGKTALLLVWDNASWHRSQAVRHWIRAHNQRVKQERHGIRLVPCLLPVKSPWLNPLEAHWVHGKRAVVEPSRLLTARELMERVNTHFGCPHHEPLVIPQKVS